MEPIDVNQVISQAINDLQNLQAQMQSTELIAAVPETKVYFKDQLTTIVQSITDAIPSVDNIT